MTISDQELLKLQMECTVFFENNPYAYETARGLAKKLGRGVEPLAIVLNRLAAISILEKRGEGNMAIYSYKTPYTQNEVEIH
ncbi:hypothetical protein [Saccharibacillus endophyticus]|uniref:Uncharacterized protein n=1 Tax=Saccharibacillus endophyticus TaxID=2060666 RepID=A0ABQ2A5K8_9BACL|nr:hypothetical protein [Saccharibacillus endophyticus]GGH86538.1 hypothetical protein GCM10007362_46550 [Saccharibacillus endophyticus]